MSSPLLPDEIEFTKYSDDMQATITVRRRGRVFNVAGRQVILFPVSVLAEAIGREVQTIRRWERQKLWPAKSMWKVPDNRCKRWYSSAQILGIHTKHKEMSRGDYGVSHSPHFDLLGFLKYVREQFYKFDTDVLAAMNRKPERKTA